MIAYNLGCCAYNPYLEFHLWRSEDLDIDIDFDSVQALREI